MVRPASFPTYATNANYTTGPHNGTPTKIAMVSGDTQNGNISGVFPNARKWNWWQNLVGNWITELAAELDVLNGVVTSQPFVIWRPGEPSPSGNVYASLTSAVTAALALNVPTPWVWIDNSITASPTMPTSAVTGGDRCILASAVSVTLNFGANAQLTNWRAMIATPGATITVNITSATGGAVVSNASGPFYTENCAQTLSAGSRRWINGMSVFAHNCRIENIVANTALRVTGGRTSWGPILNGTVASLVIEGDKLFWRPGTDTSGPVFSEPTARSEAMVTAWLAGLVAENKIGHCLVLDCLYSAGVYTTTTDIDLQSRANLEVVNHTRLTLGSGVLILNPCEYIDLNNGQVAIPNAYFIGLTTGPTHPGSPVLSIRNISGFGDYVGSGTRYIINVGPAWANGRYKTINLHNCLQRIQANCPYIRQSGVLPAGTYTVNISGEKLEGLAAVSAVIVNDISGGTAAAVHLVVNWNSPAPIRHEKMSANWSPNGTAKTYDKWNVRLPKSFPVQHNGNATNSWNFRVLWPDMPDGYYFARISQYEPGGAGQVDSMEFGISVSSQTVTGVVFADNGTQSSVYQPRKVTVNNGLGNSHVSFSSGNLTVANTGQSYGGGGTTLTIIGSTIDGM